MANLLRIVEGRYLQDILDQPRAITETVAGLRAAPEIRDLRAVRGRLPRIVLTGMGSSFFALHPLHLRLVAQGVAPSLVETSELVHSQAELLARETLVVAVSQSGESAEIIRLLDMAGRGFYTVGVTNSGESPLAQRAETVLLTHAGEEATVACKTSSATLVALHWLGALLLGEDLGAVRVELEPAAAAVGSYLGAWRDHVVWLASRLDGVSDIFLAGRGASLAAVGMGGLIVKEATHLHAEGLSAAALRHGPFEMLGPSCFVLVFAGETAHQGMNGRLARDVAAAGARAALVSESAAEPALRLPAASSAIRSILETLPMQMITLAIPALTGREAGTFVRATKVTSVE
jgi:glucosamine--fructose-6-phosphate aminotransferase (isomerizing)